MRQHKSYLKSCTIPSHELHVAMRAAQNSMYNAVPIVTLKHEAIILPALIKTNQSKSKSIGGPITLK